MQLKVWHQRGATLLEAVVVLGASSVLIAAQLQGIIALTRQLSEIERHSEEQAISCEKVITGQVQYHRCQQGKEEWIEQIAGR